MTRWTPDPTFYPSPRDAANAPAEQLAYVAAFDRAAEKPDAIAVVDTDLGGIVGRRAHPSFPGEPLAGGPQMV